MYYVLFVFAMLTPVLMAVVCLLYTSDAADE